MSEREWPSWMTEEDRLASESRSERSRLRELISAAQSSAEQAKAVLEWVNSLPPHMMEYMDIAQYVHLAHTYATLALAEVSRG